MLNVKKRRVLRKTSPQTIACNLADFGFSLITVYEVRNHLFLNMIDPLASLDFIEKHISKRKVIIHCNLGLSRAPSIALLYLAKRAKVINGESYVEAAKDFVQIFPLYKPSRGIVLYLSIKWPELQ